MTVDIEDDEAELYALAAEYTLGLLSAEEAKAFEELMAVDPEFRAAYAVWAEDFAGLADALPQEVPPKAVWSELESRLFPETKQSLLERLGLIPAIFGGLVAAMLVLLVTDRFGLMPGPTQPGPVLVAEIAAEDQSLILQARFSPDSGRLDVVPVNGAAREGRVLELWLIAGGNAPVSLGVLPEDGVYTLDVPADLKGAVPGAVLALSDEPPGGSPTGAPTGDVLAVGTVATL